MTMLDTDAVEAAKSKAGKGKDYFLEKRMRALTLFLLRLSQQPPVLQGCKIGCGFETKQGWFASLPSLGVCIRTFGVSLIRNKRAPRIQNPRCNVG